jgi:hypothetical protein
MMPRTALVVASGLALATSPLSAQAHEAHRHPRGGKIIMVGTLVDPVCAFAQQLTDSAQARCSGQHADDSFEPALLTDENELYVLAFDPGASGRSASLHAMIGKQVKVDGTVFPAGNAYLIVVDSIRTSMP